MRPRVLVLAGWALLGLAWAVANPPFAAPDEQDHFVRAYGLASGHWVGAPAPGVTRGANEAERKWVGQTIRQVTLPPGLDPSPFAYVRDPAHPVAYLNAARPTTQPRQVATGVGTYQPLAYVLPGLVEEDVPLAVELRDGGPVSELSQAGEAAISGAAVAVVV